MIYPIPRYNELVQETFAEIVRLGVQKGGEYAGDTDRLNNFRRNAANWGLTMEQCWGVYAGKHWDAIQQYIRDRAAGVDRVRTEPLSGRVDDMIVYLLLFKAMLDEASTTDSVVQTLTNQLETDFLKDKNNGNSDS